MVGAASGGSWGWGGGGEEGRGQAPVYSSHNIKCITFLPSLYTDTDTHTGKEIKTFAFSPLNLSNPLIFRIVKHAKVTEVNR